MGALLFLLWRLHRRACLCAAQFLLSLSTMAVWVRLPLGQEADGDAEGPAPAAASDVGGSSQGMPCSLPANAQPPAALGWSGLMRGMVPAEDAWGAWNQVRCMCSHNPRLGVILDVPASLPSREEVARWVLPGFPVVSPLSSCNRAVATAGMTAGSGHHLGAAGSFLFLGSHTVKAHMGEVIICISGGRGSRCERWRCPRRRF